MDLPELDPVIHQRTRLQIVTFLHRNREAPLAGVREALELTYGNLDSHLAKLEEAGYVDRRRALTPDGFQVRVRITAAGEQAFRGYLAGLRTYLAQGLREGPASPERP